MFDAGRDCHDAVCCSCTECAAWRQSVNVATRFCRVHGLTDERRGLPGGTAIPQPALRNEQAGQGNPKASLGAGGR